MRRAPKPDLTPQTLPIKDEVGRGTHTFQAVFRELRKDGLECMGVTEKRKRMAPKEARQISNMRV